MTATVVVGLSAVLQITAVILAFRLFRLAGERKAWPFIVLALLLMVYRRVIVLGVILSGQQLSTLEFSGEWAGLFISLFMVISIAVIEPLFRTLKHSESLQRQEAERIRLLIENTPAAIAMFDRDMRYLLASQRWLQDYRLTDQNIIGRSHYEVFPEIPDRWKEIHRRCLAGAVERCEEDPFPRADGTMDWVRWEIHPWQDSRGDIGGIVMFTEVITERKRAEQALRESEEFSRSIINSLKANVAVLDCTGTILAVNRAWLEFARENRTDLIARSDIGTNYLSVCERASAEEAPHAREALEGIRAVLDGKKDQFDLEYDCHSPTEKRWFLMRVAPLSARPGGAVISHIDITGQKKMEEALLKASRMEATATLAGGIAHDFNNLMVGVLGNAEILKQISWV